MTIFPACQIIEKDGRYGIDVATRYNREFQEALSKYKGFVQVILKQPSRSRTVLQNATYRSFLSLYYESGIHSCRSYEELHVTLKVRYGVVLSYTVDGKPVTDIVSTSDYDIKELADLITGTMAEMEQMGILTLNKYGDKYNQIIEGMKANEEIRKKNE